MVMSISPQFGEKLSAATKKNKQDNYLENDFTLVEEYSVVILLGFEISAFMHHWWI